MAKNAISGVGRAAGVKPKGSGVAGGMSRVRTMAAQGEKVTPPAGSPIAAPKPSAAAPQSVASGDNIIMPVDHPAAKSTRTVKGGGMS